MEYVKINNACSLHLQKFNVDHSEYLSLLKKVRSLPKIKKVFIRSGIRYDYLMEDKNTKFFS